MSSENPIFFIAVDHPSFVRFNVTSYLFLFFLKETYPSTPPVWFADSEDTSVTNAVQILSNTSGRDNHVSGYF